jgi:hypothetical protein
MIKSRRMRWEGHLTRKRVKRNEYKFLVGKPVEKSRKGLDVNGRMKLGWISREIGWGGMDCTDLAQDMDKCGALVNRIINLRVP